MMTQQLSRETLDRILEAPNIEKFTFDQLLNSFLDDAEISKFTPDGVCQVDPRNGDRIVFNSTRAKRPHDNRPLEEITKTTLMEKDCLICQGQTTNVIDVADLSEGFTFINKNLFPVFYPSASVHSNGVDKGDSFRSPDGMASHGMHFLQWTSSSHDKDWHNMPQRDRIIVLQRLAVLEKKLVTESSGYVSIIKNYGYLVGGSLVHGHQQICFSNVMPSRFQKNLFFNKKYGEMFSTFLLRENPSELLVRDYGSAVLIIPYFMRRPFDMLLLLKDTTKRYLHELTKDEIIAVVDGWHDAIRAILLILPQIGRETAYNITSNNGPGTGLYFEFLPYTQETGGLEQLGLYSCQGNPHTAAKHIREILARGPKDSV